MAITKITGASIAADSIDGTKIADDAINSEHITDGGVDDVHIGDLAASKLTGSVAAGRIASNTIDSAHITAGAVDDAHLATGITSSKLTGALPAIDGSNLTGITTDTTTIENNIAMLAFFRASDNSKAKYDLVDQVIDEYTDATGVASSTGGQLAGSGALKYYASISDSVGSTVTTTYPYSGSDSTIALANNQTINGTVKAWGAGGGSDSASSGEYGAAGGYITGTLAYASDGTDLIVSVGQGGPMGANGGAGGTGGGYTGLFLGSKTHGNTMIIAGAGGGAGDHENGGEGGGTTGARAWLDGSRTGGYGGTQSAGGAVSLGTSSYSNPTAGSALQGGIGGSASDSTSHPTAYNGGGRQGNEPGGSLGGGGGGGGYYGGGGGHNGSYGAGGGGGSSYHNATYFSSVTNTQGNDQTPPATGDANYTSGVGTAGTNTNGGGGSLWFSYAITTQVVSATMALISNTTTAGTAPSTGDIVMLIENAEGTATLNTDIKGYVSRNGGTTYTQGTLVDEGSWGTNKKILAFHDLDISGQSSGTSMKYKIELANQSEGSKETRIHATSLAWV